MQQPRLSDQPILTRASRAAMTTMLDAHTLTQPDERTALVYLSVEQPPITVTRDDFRQTVYGCGAALRGLGVREGDLVIVAHTQNLESIYLFWGALILGAIPAMFPTLTEKLDPDLYMANLAELVRFSDVRCVLTTDAFAPVLAERVACPVYGSAALGNTTPLHDAIQPDPEQIAFLQHSSGTTGLQKGVALSHRALLNQIASYSDAIALSEHDVIVSWLPLYHDMGLIAGFLLPLIQGIPLILMSPFEWAKSPAMLFRAISTYGGTLCWLPNFAYNHCARRIRQRDLDGLSAATMRMFINCSEPVYHESHTLFAERFAGIGVNPSMLAVSYAMAENTFAVTQTAPGSPPALDVIDQEALAHTLTAQPVPADHPNASIRVSCGRPIPNAACRAVDDFGAVLPDRQVGELVVQSNSMLTGYYKRPDLQPFRDGWYLTGDRGYTVEGEVYIVGRSKDLIINAGKNVYPQDVEAVVNTVAGVHPGRAVVFGVPDAREGTELIAVVAEVNDPDPESQKAISQQIRQRVAQHTTVTVSYVTLVEAGWLIKTSSGKIARAANRSKWLAGRGETA
ncbi:MAG: AMP-binding protein [bacterium]|nr:AMP-binding protein [bacterium]